MSVGPDCDASSGKGGVAKQESGRPKRWSQRVARRPFLFKQELAVGRGERASLRPLRIVPFVGIDDFRLGSSRDEVLERFGSPTRLYYSSIDENLEFFTGDEEADADIVRHIEIWTYGEHGVELCFSVARKDVLSSISTECPHADLFGERYMGLSEYALEDAVKIEPLLHNLSFCYVDPAGVIGASCYELCIDFHMWGGFVSSIEVSQN